jgi:hypothetical protein
MVKLKWNPPPIKSMLAVFYNEDDAAVFAHEGTTRMDDSETPARPFITAGAESVDVLKEFKANYSGQIRLGAVERAFEAVADQIHEEIMYLITEDVWDWDRRTYRKSGEVVDSPRNIVDLGGVRDGQKCEVFEADP